MAEPTAALNFGDLLLQAALAANTAYYGEDGLEPAQIPLDDHDLDDAKRAVNNAIRTFIGDSPPTGWRWLTVVRDLVVWTTVAASASQTVSGGTYDVGNDETLITATASVFQASMERKTLDFATSTDATIKTFVSATQVRVEGDSSAVSAEQFTITADGDYTLPQDFSGDVSGEVTYASATNIFPKIRWSDESTIRNLRENSAVTSSDPWLAAIRAIEGTERRYELLAYPTPSTDRTLQFPYEIHFSELSDPTTFTSVPFKFDKILRQLVRAVVEEDIDDIVAGPRYNRYTAALPAAYAADARSAPRRLGMLRNPSTAASIPNAIRAFRGAVDVPNITLTGF